MTKDRNNKEDEVWVTLRQGGETYSRYEVSNYGRVWDLKNNVEVSQVETGKPVYKYVNLSRDDKSRTLRRVHNIIGWSFLGEPPTPKHTVDHIDKNKFNNHLDNLRWLDRRGQMNNRENTLICDCGKPLTELLRSDRDIDESYDGAFLRQWFNQGVCDYRVLKSYWSAYKTYGSSWCRQVKVNSNTYKLYELVESFDLDFEDTLCKLNKDITFEGVVKGYKVPLYEEKEYKHSIEHNSVWFPNKDSLCKHYSISKGALKHRRNNMTLEEALTYDQEDRFRFFLGDYFLSRQEHCTRLGLSFGRIQGKMDKHKISFEDAIQLPLERINKHCINGIIKRNFEWYEHFGLDNSKRCINSYNCKHKNFRKTLEHFGVDTSEMEIYPCDGNIVCKSRPL